MKKLTNLQKAFILCGFAVFAVYALCCNIFGTAATSMMAFFDISESRQGFLLTVQSVGSIAATVYLALWGERFNKIKVLAGGAVIMALGTLAIGIVPKLCGAAAGYYALMPIMVIFGLGFTTADIMLNSTMPDVFPEHSATLLPMIHAFFSVGAVAAPLFTAALINSADSGSFTVPYIVAGVIALAVAAAYTLVGRRITPQTPYADMTEQRRRTSENPAEIFRFKKAWLYMLASFLYFFFQHSIASWLPTFCQTELGCELSVGGTVMSAFFAGSLVMRFVSPPLLKRIPHHTFYILFTTASAVAFVAGLLSHSTALMYVMFTLSGFLQGAISPVLVMMCCAEFPTRTASASSAIVGSISLATFVGPWAIGKIAGSTGFLFPMILCAASMVLSALVIFAISRMKSAPAENS